MLRWRVGDVTVTRIVEMETGAIGGFVLPQATREIIDGIPWLRPHFLDKGVEQSEGSTTADG